MATIRAPGDAPSADLLAAQHAACVPCSSNPGHHCDNVRIHETPHPLQVDMIPIVAQLRQAWCLPVSQRCHACSQAPSGRCGIQQTQSAKEGRGRRRLARTEAAASAAAAAEPAAEGAAAPTLPFFPDRRVSRAEAPVVLEIGEETIRGRVLAGTLGSTLLTPLPPRPPPPLPRLPACLPPLPAVCGGSAAAQPGCLPSLCQPHQRH
jgi:hypothetical protein